MAADRIDALQQALALTPDNHPLRLMLAETLEEAGRLSEALQQYEILLQGGHLPREMLLRVGEIALRAGTLELALHCLDVARHAGIVDGVADLQVRIDAAYAERGFLKVALPVAPAPSTSTTLVAEEERPITFSEIGGLENVKKVIHRMIILPLVRADLYQAYGRRSGGGILLYGPPGCGKTLLARATAGECQLPFINVRIEDILDPYLGVSERNLHRRFEEARAKAPCLLFIDELDALAYARRKQQSSAARPLVDQLLQELDAIGADNRGVLILGATNAPWDIDDALLRPGRFDRRIFVPPPDEEARRRILTLMFGTVPSRGVDLKKLAKETPLFSGADLRALVDQAVDLAIEEALDIGDVQPLTMGHLERVRRDLRPTTLDWLARAQNYVEFANQDDRYKEVALFLQSREAKSWKRR